MRSVPARPASAVSAKERRRALASWGGVGRVVDVRQDGPDGALITLGSGICPDGAWVGRGPGWRLARVSGDGLSGVWPVVVSPWGGGAARVLGAGGVIGAGGAATGWSRSKELGSVDGPVAWAADVGVASATPRYLVGEAAKACMAFRAGEITASGVPRKWGHAAYVGPDSKGCRARPLPWRRQLLGDWAGSGGRLGGRGSAQVSSNLCPRLSRPRQRAHVGGGRRCASLRPGMSMEWGTPRRPRAVQTRPRLVGGSPWAVRRT